MTVFAARKPIFDAGKKACGYELLFREGLDAWDEHAEAAESDGGGRPPVGDSSACVNLESLTDGTIGLVTLTPDAVSKGCPPLLRTGTAAVGLPADCQADARALDALRRLKESGCAVVVNDFAPNRQSGDVLDLADIATVDFAATPAERHGAILEELAARRLLPIAKNVQRAEQFDEARDCGYAHFHGEFFAAPAERSDRDIPPGKLIQLEILREVNQPELSFGDMEELIRRDVSLTHKLLRFINSVWFGLRYEVKSIRHALVLLGPAEIRRWASLLVVTDTGAEKPHELLRRSLARAHFAEKLAPLVALGSEAAELFLMGMLSCIDALLDAPLAELLDELSLHRRIKDALLTSAGKFGQAFDTILAYERGDWTWLASCVEALGIDERSIPPLYWGSLRWAAQCIEQAWE